MEKEELAQYCIDNPYKTPAFQFYPESWYGSGHVSLMSDNERGIHACLIFSAWLESNCGIKNFDDDIISAARSKDIVSIKKVLNLSWFLFNGFWFSIKLCRERVKQIQISGFRSKAASVKWMKNKKHTAKAKQLQCKRYANQEIQIEKEIEIRSKSFKELINAFINTYPQSMLDDFYKYWSEPNRSNKKMKYELQETWDLSRRLNTWASRDKNFNKTIPTKKPMSVLRAEADERERLATADKLLRGESSHVERDGKGLQPLSDVLKGIKV
jgi:uncharacterized protein YdaU (DUF1376 family)